MSSLPRVSQSTRYGRTLVYACQDPPPHSCLLLIGRQSRAAGRRAASGFGCGSLLQHTSTARLSIEPADIHAVCSTPFGFRSHLPLTHLFGSLLGRRSHTYSFTRNDPRRSSFSGDIICFRYVKQSDLSPPMTWSDTMRAISSKPSAFGPRRRTSSSFRLGLAYLSGLYRIISCPVFGSKT